MVVRVLFVLSIIGTVALISVGIAIYLRVKRHLHPGRIDAQVQSAIEEATQSTAEET